MTKRSDTLPPPATPEGPAATPAAPPAAPERRPVEAWAEQRGTPAWALAAARHARRWPVGQEITAEQYDQAVVAAANEEIR